MMKIFDLEARNPGRFESGKQDSKKANFVRRFRRLTQISESVKIGAEGIYG